MNTDQTSQNILAYFKMHCAEAILPKIQNVEKTMIKY